MNKIQFHEGGMPVNLDDLQLLQDNITEMFKAIIRVLSGGNEVFLIQSPEIKYDSTKEYPNATRVGPGLLYVKGELVSWEEHVFEEEPELHKSIWAVIQRGEDDPREFADGQVRKCRSRAYATLHEDRNGAEEAYDLLHVPRIGNLLSDVVESKIWRSTSASFSNGYQGEMLVRRRENSLEISLNLKSGQTEWTGDKNGDYYNVCSIHESFGRLESKEDVRVYNSQADTVGWVKLGTYGAIRFKPEKPHLTPWDCPINTTIKISW